MLIGQSPQYALVIYVLELGGGEVRVIVPQAVLQLCVLRMFCICLTGGTLYDMVCWWFRAIHVW